MKVVALLTVRNGASYLKRCLDHLVTEGIAFCIIDNDSTDATGAIAQEFAGRGLVSVERLPFEGHFDLVAQLRQQQQLSKDIEADWFIHHDVDEILEAAPGYPSLREGIIAADRCNYNVINFDEFIFVPGNMEDFDGRDYVQEMRNYFFFEPEPYRLLRAWKKSSHAIDLVSSGGHRPRWTELAIFPHNFILRHYMFLSARHAIQKYTVDRSYSSFEVEQGWHGWRPNFSEAQFQLPPRHTLKTYLGGRVFDKSDPRRYHEFVKLPEPETGR